MENSKTYANKWHCRLFVPNRVGFDGLSNPAENDAVTQDLSNITRRQRLLQDSSNPFTDLEAMLVRNWRATERECYTAHLGGRLGISKTGKVVGFLVVIRHK